MELEGSTLEDPLALALNSELQLLYALCPKLFVKHQE